MLVCVFVQVGAFRDKRQSFNGLCEALSLKMARSFFFYPSVLRVSFQLRCDAGVDGGWSLQNFPSCLFLLQAEGGVGEFHFGLTLPRFFVCLSFTAFASFAATSLAFIAAAFKLAVENFFTV